MGLDSPLLTWVVVAEGLLAAAGGVEGLGVCSSEFESRESATTTTVPGPQNYLTLYQKP